MIEVKRHHESTCIPDAIVKITKRRSAAPNCIFYGRCADLCSWACTHIQSNAGDSTGIFLEAIGIPTYGVPGDWSDPDGNGVHGLNEREAVRAVFIGRDFWTDLVKAYADGK